MKSSLNVALFSGNYNYQADGANKALNRLVAFLVRQGVCVKVFSPTTQTPAFPPAGELISVPSIPVPGRGEYRIGLPLNSKIKRELDRFQPDLIHLSAPDWLNHSALKYAERRNIPVVASFHTRFDTYFRYYGMRWVEAFIKKRLTKFYDRCLAVYVPSPSVGDVLERDGIIGANRRLWGRGINHQNFNPAFRCQAWRSKHGIQSDDVAVAFVGRLVKEKGLDDYAALIDALVLRGLPVKALIVGDGPEYSRLRRRLPDAVMTGHLSGEELSRAYASADIFSNPSLTETFGNVTLEAMASGVPTVCVDATGSRDLVDHGETGFLIPSAQHLGWFERTAELCEKADIRKIMGAAGVRKSAAYDWETILQSMLDDYRVLAQQKFFALEASAQEVTKASAKEAYAP